MKKIAILGLGLVLLLVLSGGTVLAAGLYDPGFDEYGYNYQAHLFNGWDANTPRPDTVYEGTWGDPGELWLVMKWNDVWLSNKDRDDDGKLDRHWGFDSYIGSGAWCTNHFTGWYQGDDDNVHQYKLFGKIVAVPEDATLSDGVWYTADGTEIGPAIWGQFALIQCVLTDPYGGYPIGELEDPYKSPAGPGLGKW